MTISPIKSPPALGAALVALLLAPGLALAQTDAPIQLTPHVDEVLVSPNAAPQPAPPAKGPVQVIQSPAARPAPAPAPAGGSGAFPTMTPANTAITVQPLAAVSVDATGTLTNGNGGFGTDLWAGVGMATVQAVLPLLPAAPGARAERSLERRLLLSVAQAPSGPAGGGAPLLALRAEKLWSMGAVDDLNAFLKGVSLQAFTPPLRHLAADAALLAGDTATACAQASALRGQGDDTYAAMVSVYCQFAGGKASEASLTEDVLREQKVKDPAFFIAADALGGIAPGRLTAFDRLTPLDLALARAAKLALPEAAAGTPVPALQAALAKTASASPDARLIAAEKAEMAGALDTATLRQIYDATSFTPQELALPLGPDKGPRGRALSYHTAIQPGLSAAARIEVIGKALAAAGDASPLYAMTARLYADALAAITPAPELTGFAYTAARALLAAGRPDAAKPWLTALRAQGNAPQAMQAVAGLWPLLRMAVAEDGQPLPAAALEAWRLARADQADAASQRRAAVAYSLLAALGESVPAQAWLPLLNATAGTAAPARPALLQELHGAAAARQVGGTVLFALAALGDTGLDQADPSLLYQVVAALKQAGLDKDARALAVDAAIANGV
ncbi:hypothetical protein GALL_208660 [mine drainage metagenome]|uniref:Antifreeze glycopeptide polyprotein n=1 Tax=mine drainage metagenome TaxID=410659 RepID=A0A1J5RMB6_9ZZZZ